MKKVLFLMIVSLFSMNLSAQVMRAEELEKLCKGKLW
mgnify:CR=1 FL=1